MPACDVPEKLARDKIKIDPVLDGALCVRRFVAKAESTRTPLAAATSPGTTPSRLDAIMSNLKVRELEVVLRVS